MEVCCSDTNKVQSCFNSCSSLIIKFSVQDLIMWTIKTMQHLSHCVCPYYLFGFVLNDAQKLRKLQRCARI